MSKTITAALAVVLLAGLTACAPAPEEVVYYEPIPEPIIHDVPSGKYRK